MVGLCNIPLSHFSTLRADILTLLHYCNRQAHVPSACVYVCVRESASIPDVLILQCSQTCSFMLCPPLQAHTCYRQNTRERTRGDFLFSSEEESRRRNVMRRRIVCVHLCISLCVCVCVCVFREPPSLGVVYGLVTTTFLHSAAKLLSSTFQREEERRELKKGGETEREV